MKVSDIAMEGTWYRCSDYILQDGFVRPAPGATVESYALFDALQQGSNEESQARKPGICEELANLGAHDEEAILAFVRKWGLLGLLPHRMEYAEFASGAIWSRNRTGWTISLSTMPDIRTVNPDTWKRIYTRGQLPGRLLVTAWDNSKKMTDAAEVMADHFPDGPLPGGYPAPVDDEFWQHYSERITDIAGAAFSLHSALQQMANFQELRKLGQLPEDYSPSTARSWITANANISPATALNESMDQAATLYATSLLGAVATMFWLDWGGKKTVKVCGRPGCGKVFLANRQKAEYCSDSCKKAAQNARYYTEHPEKWKGKRT